MKKFKFIITDQYGNSRIESFATSENTREAAYIYARSLWPGYDIELYQEPIWKYAVAGFIIGTVISFIFIFVIK